MTETDVPHEQMQRVLERLGPLGKPRDVWRDHPESRDYPREFGLTEADVPALIAVMQRWALPWPEGDKDQWEKHPELFAPIHTWRTLGQLRAVEAIEPMLAMLDPLDEVMDDFSLEEFPVVWSLIGQPAIEPLTRFIRDRRRREFSRVCAVSGLEKIGLRHPDLRDPAVAALTDLLAEHDLNGPIVNGHITSSLVDLRARESAEIIERAYAAHEVDPWVCGNWATVRRNLGVRGLGLVPEEEAGTPAPPLPGFPPFEAIRLPPAGTAHPASSQAKRRRHKRERQNRRKGRRR